MLSGQISSLTLPVGQMSANCHILYDERSHEGVIIDPGDDADFIIRKITDLEIKPLSILATHGHFDHVMAVNEIKIAYKIPFLIHQSDLPILRNMRESAKYFLGIDPGPAPIPDDYLKNNSKLDIGHFSLKVIGVPGHTPGSVALYSSKVAKIFVGDLVFAGGGVGRTDHKYSDEKKLIKSIKKILRMPEGIEVYPGHGRETTIAELAISLTDYLSTS